MEADPVRIAGIDRDDLLQETWVRLLERPPTEVNRGWLATVMRNVSLPALLCSLPLLLPGLAAAQAGGALAPAWSPSTPLSRLPKGGSGPKRSLTAAR